MAVSQKNIWREMFVKNFLRIVAFLLAFLMVSSVFVACNKTPEDDGEEETTASVETERENDDGEDNKVEETDTAAAVTTEAATTEAATQSASASKLQGNFGGAEYRILAHYDDNKGFYDFEVDYEEIPEDVVGKAVWDRNVLIEEKYGLEVVGTQGSPSADANVFIGAGDDQQDLIISRNDVLLGFATSGYFVNINSMPNINFEMDCWNLNINEQFTYGDKMFYSSSKFLLQEKHRTWMLWYNRDLAAELKIGYLEDEVFNNTWTMDRVIEIARTASANTDGKDGMTFDDRWGFVGADPYVFGQLAYGAGFRLSNKGNDGYPQLVGATTEMNAILDKIFELSANRNISFFSEYRPTADENGMDYGEGIFRDGRAVLMGEAVSYLEQVSKLDFAYGVLPNPKFNSNQKDYISMPNKMNGHLFAVPVTVGDIEKAGFGLQAISEESVATSYNAYIEERCKKQDAQDLDMAKCLGIIFDNVAWDVALIDNIGGLGEVMRKELLVSGSNTYSRLYKSKERKANTQIKNNRERNTNGNVNRSNNTNVNRTNNTATERGGRSNSNSNSTRSTSSNVNKRSTGASNNSFNTGRSGGNTRGNSGGAVRSGGATTRGGRR